MEQQTTTTTTKTTTPTTSVHVTALDGIVNVNAIFTLAVFVGMSLTTPRQRRLEDRDVCHAGANVAEMLLVWEVVCFSFFLSSSLIAHGLKMMVNLINSNNADDADKAYISLKLLRYGILGSAVGSFMGFIFLTLSMMNVIQIRLGLLSCGSKNTVRALVALYFLVLPSLLAYLLMFLYAFSRKPSPTNPPLAPTNPPPAL